MKLRTTAFADMARIPGECAFGVVDAEQHVRLSTNRNPDFAWEDVPIGTRSLALICHDPDVPSRGDDVNKEGRVVPASLPRVDFFHWVLIDLQAGSATTGDSPPGDKQPSEWQTDWYFNESISNNTPEVYSPNYLTRSGR